MTREEMEHVLRAASALTGETEFVVVGSQALLALAATLPDALSRSMELDLYPLHRPEAADLIDGCIGELSPFHETFGYYAHGVGPETAPLPRNWRRRAVEWKSDLTGGARAICPGPADLALSKLVAGREKDMVFVRAMLEHGWIKREDLVALLDELSPEQRGRAEMGIRSLG